MKTEWLCAKLLVAYGISPNAEPGMIDNLKTFQSQNYALGPVYAFDYRNKHYYVVDDYSLGDDPNYVKNILADINHLLTGEIVEKPLPQPVETKYAMKLGSSEYYLWKS